MNELRSQHAGDDIGAAGFFPRTLEQALRFMRRRHFCRSRAWRDLRMRTILGHADPDVAAFCLRLFDVCEGVQVPVRLYVYDPGVLLYEFSAEWLRRDIAPAVTSHDQNRRFVMIEHAILGTALPAVCWEVLRSLAYKAADRADVQIEGRSDQDHFPHMIALEGSTGWDGHLSAKAEFRRLEREWFEKFNRRDPSENA